MALSITTTPVQGDDVLAEVSEDNGVTWLKLVCLMKQGFESTRSINKTLTQCGQLVGKGVLDNSIPLEGAVNVAVVAGYASYKKMQTWMKDFTALLFRQLSPTATGVDIANRTSCYLTDLKLDLPVDDIAKFSGTLTGTGAWTIV